MLRLDNDIINFLTEAGCLPNGHIAGNIRWQAVFFMGPAASGKGYVKARRYLRHLDFKSVDPDDIKESHPDYDPEKPFELHAWSKNLSDAKYNNIVTDGSGSPVIVDGTGTNWKETRKKMILAKRNGYKTYIVYVYAPFEVSIWRNRKRDRFVPERVILHQSRQIADSYKQLARIADKTKTILNYSSSELKKAKADIELYPVPQDVRPPRPGQPEYGLKLSYNISSSGNRLKNFDINSTMDREFIASELLCIARMMVANSV